MSVRKNLVPILALISNFIICINLFCFANYVSSTIFYSTIIHIAIAYFIREKMNFEQSLESFFSMAESMPTMVWVADKNKNRIYFNGFWSKFCGRELSDLTNEGWLNLLHEEDYEQFLNVHFKNYSSKSEFQIDYRILRKDGQFRWVREKADPIFINGIFHGYMGTATDVHDVVALQERLFEEETRYELIAKGIGVGFWDWNIRHDEIYLSDNLKEILHDESEGNFYDFVYFLKKIHPDDVERFNLEISNHFRTQKPYKSEIRIMLGNGDFKHCEISGASFFDGTIASRMAGSIYDLSQIKQSESTIAELTSAMENAVEGIAKLDREGNYLLFNDSYANLFDFDSEKMLGVNWKLGVFSEDIYNLDLAVKALKNAQKKTFQCRVIQDGNIKFIENTVVPKINIDNELESFYCFAKDVTDRMNSEEKLGKLIEQLTNSNADLEKFAYVASHDLQEPLRIISIFSELLRKKDLNKFDETSQKYIKYSIEAAKRMQELINDLLEFSRIGQSGGDLQEVDASRALSFAIENLSEQIAANRAIIKIDNLPIIKTNAVRLTRLFQNLIGNAIKYRREFVVPHIKISAQEERDCWVFNVADNGIGIDEEYVDRIFDPFKRLHSKESYEGTGIGLAICKRIVIGFGGEIWVKSKVDQGSEFFFSLPK